MTKKKVKKTEVLLIIKHFLAVRYITTTFIRSEVKQTDQIKVFLYGETLIFAFVVFTALVWRERSYH